MSSRLHELELGEGEERRRQPPLYTRPRVLGRLLLGAIALTTVWCLANFMSGSLADMPEPLPPPSEPDTPPRYALNPPPNPAYATAFEADTYAHRSHPSAVFAPIVVRDCTHLTPGWFAPCVALRTPFAARTYAEELIYPDFGLPEPLFAREEHARRWRAGLPSISDRGVYRDGYVLYKSQHGQNFVLNNVSYTPEGFTDEWTTSSCMGPHTRLGDLKLEPAPANGTQGTGLVVNSPDSWSFQHWLDRAAHVVAQSAHLTLRDATALTGKRGSGMVQALWDRIGFEGRVLHRPTEVLAFNALVFSCKAVLIHPFLSWRALELMRLPFAMANWPDVPDTKQTVLYMSRSDGRTSNPGRVVLNEAAVIGGIEDLLETRGKGETLALWSDLRLRFDSDLNALVDFLWRNVSAIVGPHGGALMNHRFAGPGTLVFEFLPTSRLSYLNFEEASMLNQTYAAVVVEPAAETLDDMVVEPADVVALLDQHLGRARPENIILDYQWDRE